MLLPSGPDMVRGLYCTGPEARHSFSAKNCMLRYLPAGNKEEKQSLMEDYCMGVETEHLRLGSLCEEKSFTAEILRKH
jgi:hypothetical protein